MLFINRSVRIQHSKAFIIYAKIYVQFSGGFALLPFLWFINSVWFFNEAFRKPEYDEQKEIKNCEYIR